MLLLEEQNQLLADLAAELDQIAAVGSAHQHADFHGAFTEIGDLHREHLLVPQRRGFDHLLRLGAQRFDRRLVVEIHHDEAEQVHALARPVLERLLDEIAERQHQPPQIPGAHHHIGRGDVLHIAEIALDDQRIPDLDRLGDGDLDAGAVVERRNADGALSVTIVVDQGAVAGVVVTEGFAAQGGRVAALSAGKDVLADWIWQYGFHEIPPHPLFRV